MVGSEAGSIVGDLLDAMVGLLVKTAALLPGDGAIAMAVGCSDVVTMIWALHTLTVAVMESSNLLSLIGSILIMLLALVFGFCNGG